MSDSSRASDRAEIESHDMQALGNMFREDGIWVLWTGQVWEGRAAIAEGLAAVHRTVFRNSMQREQLEELTFVGPDAAVVRGAWKVGWGQNTRFADTTPE